MFMGWRSCLGPCSSGSVLSALGRRHSISWAASLGAALLTLSLARTAAADGSWGGWDYGCFFDLGLRHQPQVPKLKIPEDPDDERSPTRMLPSPGRSAPVIYGAMGFTFVFNDWLVVPSFGAEVGFGVGSQPRVFSSTEGQIVESQPWTTSYVFFSMPGIGVRFKHRRWMAQLTMVTGVSYLTMNTRLSDGPNAEDIRGSATGFAVRAVAEVCRRLDPEHRACLFATPSLYEFGAFNGGAVGLRWEMGP